MTKIKYLAVSTAYVNAIEEKLEKLYNETNELSMALDYFGQKQSAGVTNNILRQQRLAGHLHFITA